MEEDMGTEGRSGGVTTRDVEARWAVEPWPQGPPDPALPEGEMHVWRVRVDRRSIPIEAAAENLAPWELQRAQRMRNETARRQFVVSQSAARTILSRYARCSPRDLSFGRDPAGKPVLASMPAAEWLRFNISHSGELALIAVVHSQEIGVDIEQVRPRREAARLAKRFYAPRERDLLDGLADEEWLAAFYAVWSRKEACIKALGKGIAFPLHTVDTSLVTNELSRVLLKVGPVTALELFARDLAVAPGYAAAVAVESPILPVRCWEV